MRELIFPPNRLIQAINILSQSKDNYTHEFVSDVLQEGPKKEVLIKLLNMVSSFTQVLTVYSAHRFNMS